MKKIIALSALAGAFLIVGGINAAAQGQPFSPLKVDIEKFGEVPYDTQMDWLGSAPNLILLILKNPTDMDKDLARALEILEGVKRIVDYQSRLASIVSPSTKAKLLAAISYLKQSAAKYIEARKGNKAIDLKRLGNALEDETAPQLKAIKVGMLDLFKTPTDLKTNVSAIARELGRVIADYARAQVV